MIYEQERSKVGPKTTAQNDVRRGGLYKRISWNVFNIQNGLHPAHELEVLYQLNHVKVESVEEWGERDATEQPIDLAIALQRCGLSDMNLNDLFCFLQPSREKAIQTGISTQFLDKIDRFQTRVSLWQADTLEAIREAYPSDRFPLPTDPVLFYRLVGLLLAAIEQDGTELDESAAKHPVIAALNRTFDYTLHRLHRTRNYLFHTELGLIGLVKLSQCYGHYRAMKEGGASPVLEWHQVGLFLVAAITILINKSNFAAYKMELSRPSNPKGTASYCTRMMGPIPDSDMGMKILIPIMMSLMAMSVLVENPVLDILLLACLSHAFASTKPNDKVMQYYVKGVPLPFMFSKMGLTVQEFRDDMAQTCRHTFQKLIFMFFSVRECNHFVTNQNFSVANSLFEKTVEWGLSLIHTEPCKQDDFVRLRKSVICTIENYFSHDIEKKQPLADIAQLMTANDQLTITDIQRALYRMLRGILTDSDFVLDNAQEYVHQTERFASRFINSMPFGITTIRNQRAKAIQTEMIDMLELQTVQHLCLKRMTLLDTCDVLSKKKSPLEQLRVELKKAIDRLIQQADAQSTTFRNFSMCLEHIAQLSHRDQDFDRNVEKIHLFFSACGSGKLTPTLLKSFFPDGQWDNSDEDQLRHQLQQREVGRTLWELFETMGYCALTAEWRDTFWQTFYTVAFSDQVWFSDGVKKALAHIHGPDDWIKHKDGATMTHLPKDAKHQVDQYMERYHHKHIPKWNDRGVILDTIKDMYKALFGIWPGHLKGLLAAISETSGASLIQVGRIPIADQTSYAKRFFESIKTTLRDTKNPLDIKKLKDAIDSHINQNVSRQRHIANNRYEYWILEVESLLLSRLKSLDWESNERYDLLLNWLKLMRICMDRNALEQECKALESTMSKSILTKDMLSSCKQLLKWSTQSIWNIKPAYILEEWLSYDDPGFMKEFFGKAGAVPFVLGRKGFHYLGYQTHEMARVSHNGDHSPHTFRTDRYAAMQHHGLSLHKHHFHKGISTFGYSLNKCPFDTNQRPPNINKRSCPGKLLPYIELSKTLNIAALTRVQFRFVDVAGYTHTFNSAGNMEYEDVTLALAPKGVLMRHFLGSD